MIGCQPPNHPLPVNQLPLNMPAIPNRIKLGIKMEIKMEIKRGIKTEIKMEIKNGMSAHPVRVDMITL